MRDAHRNHINSIWGASQLPGDLQRWACQANTHTLIDRPLLLCWVANWINQGHPDPRFYFKMCTRKLIIGDQPVFTDCWPQDSVWHFQSHTEFQSLHMNQGILIISWMTKLTRTENWALSSSTVIRRMMKNLKIGWLEDMTSRSEAEVFDEDCGGTRKNAISAGWTMQLFSSRAQLYNQRCSYGKGVGTGYGATKK